MRERKQIPSALEIQSVAEPNRAVMAELRRLTPARVGLRRAGDSLATAEILDFQRAHAQARDAVYAALQPSNLIGALHSLNLHERVFLLHSAAADRRTYLQRPDWGRKLDEASWASLQAFRQTQDEYDLSLVIVDGLSALAVERHAIALLSKLIPSLRKAWPSVRIAPLAVVEQGRVAIGDEIGASLRALLVVVLIGERPGLSSPDSLGAYITWHPHPGSTDAERNCISNIRIEGLGYQEAAARLIYYIREAHRLGQTGVALKDPDDVATQHALNQPDWPLNSTSGTAP